MVSGRGELAAGRIAASSSDNQIDARAVFQDDGSPKAKWAEQSSAFAGAMVIGLGWRRFP
jgi:hypothetical protein